MKRGTRKILVNFSLFFTAVFILLYINGPSPDHGNDNFAWTKIQYVSQTPSEIPARGTCPGLKASKKPILVVARMSNEDQQWLDDLKSKYHLCIYTADLHDTKSSELQTPANRGHESMAYLTFIIDNYGNLPSKGIVFIHGSQFAWHNDHPEYDNAALLSKLDINAALEEHGYHNLKCDWSMSTCSPSEALPQGSYETRSQALLEPWDKRLVSDAALPGAFAAIFGSGEQARSDPRVHLGRHNALRSQCCAQFVVSRESILQHSREEYLALRQWLLDGSDPKKKHQLDSASSDDLVAGRIMSYLWHVLFLRHSKTADTLSLSSLNAAACPSALDCYCKLYGRCGLTCRSPAHCAGQYQPPRDLILGQKKKPTST